MLPAWALALQLAIQLEPILADGVAKLIELNKLPPLSPDQMAVFQKNMNDAVAAYDADIAKGN